MKTNAFQTKLNNTRLELCQIRQSLHYITKSDQNENIELSQEDHDNFATAINGLTSMDGVINRSNKWKGSKSVKYKAKVKDGNIGDRIAAPMTFHIRATLPSMFTDIQAKLDGIKTFVDAMHEDNEDITYKNIVNTDNSKVKLTASYFKSQKSVAEAVDAIAETLVTLRGEYFPDDAAAEEEEAPEED